MKKREISFCDYKEEIRKIYRDMRLEEYYYPLIKEFIECCMLDDMSEKVIDVHKNRKTEIHDRSKYADRYSVPDMIIVPDIYTYEKPTYPYIIIEAKMPNLDFDEKEIKRYNSLKVENNCEQLRVQFEHCKYIIFTDCITWYFLKKENFFKDDFNDKISLIKTCSNEWEQEDIIWDRLKSKIIKIIDEAKQINV